MPPLAPPLLAVLLTACGGASGGASKRGPQGPAEVGYVVVQPGSVPVVTELSGRVTAYETAEVRPQVSGIVRRRLFTEGALVRAGQKLYEIDPRVYGAAVDEARANLASAEADAEATKVKADRYRPLAQSQAISLQDLTDAQAQARQAAASVAQTRAALASARVNLAFTTVPAPISGRIGRSLFTVGALVTASQADPLATIQRLDPIFVDIQQSSANLLALRRALAQGGVAPTTAVVRLTLEDGSAYGLTGAVEFSEVVVDASTGTVTLRARFRNPQGVLYPGMFLRATFAQAIDTRAFLVPQQAIARDPKGGATLFLAGADGKARQRAVTADRTVGADWVVTRGLAPGDKVIVQGLANLKPGAAIKAVPASTPQRVVAPAKGQSGGAPNRGG